MLAFSVQCQRVHSYSFLTLRLAHRTACGVVSIILLFRLVAGRFVRRGGFQRNDLVLTAYYQLIDFICDFLVLFVLVWYISSVVVVASWKRVAILP